MITDMKKFEMTERLLDENIEILKEKLDFTIGHVERCEESLEQARQQAVVAKRDLDRAMEEKREFMRLKLPYAH